MLRRALLCGAAIGASAWALPASAQRAHPHAATLRRLVALPEDQIDFGQAKLTIDQLVDPAADVAWAAHQLEQMTATVRSMMALQSRNRTLTAAAKVDVLRACLYLPGAWNGNKIFKYDLENDPTGKEILANNLLPTYLRTRLGNCVSMPILFIVLAQRLGIEATLATAPEHLFVKYRGESGAYLNLECTHDCGPKRDISYIKEFEITEKAIANRLYLQPLSKRDVVLAMAGVLRTMYYNKKDIAGLHALADLLQEHRRNSLEALQTKTTAFGAELIVRYRSKYKRFEDIPVEEREGARELLWKIKTLDERVAAMGWRQPSAEFEAAYSRLVQGARTAR